MFESRGDPGPAIVRSFLRWRPGLSWAGYGAAGCALLGVPVHAYQALDRSAWQIDRAAHFGAVGLLVGVAALAVALVHPASRRLPSAVLLVPAFVVCVAALGYAARTVAAGAGAVSGAVAAAISPDAAGSRIADHLGGAVAALTPTHPERAAVDYAQWLGGQVLSSYPAMSWTGTVLWVLALGLLLAAAAAHRLGGPTARRMWLVVVALGVLRLLA